MHSLTCILQQARPSNAPRRQLLKRKCNILLTTGDGSTENGSDLSHRAPHLSTLYFGLRAEMDESPTPALLQFEKAQAEHEERVERRTKAREQRYEQRLKEAARLEKNRRHLQNADSSPAFTSASSASASVSGSSDKTLHLDVSASTSLTVGRPFVPSSTSTSMLPNEAESDNSDSGWDTDCVYEQIMSGADPLDDDCDELLDCGGFSPLKARLGMENSVLLKVTKHGTLDLAPNSEQANENHDLSIASTLTRKNIPTFEQGLDHNLIALAIPASTRPLFIKVSYAEFQGVRRPIE